MAKKEHTESTETAIVAATGANVAMSFIDESDFGSGFEGADQASFALPFLQLLQKTSPAADEDQPTYIDGAKAGHFLNTVTKQIFDGKKGFNIIPCAYKRSFIHWAGRDAEGSFKGEFTPEQAEQLIAGGKVVAQEGKLYFPNADGSIDEKKSDRLDDTRSHYVLTISDDGEIGQAVMSLASSQIKASRALMTALNQKRVDTPNGKRMPPMFANVVRVTTAGTSNAKGSWSEVSFALNGMVTDAGTFNEAKAFYKAFASNEVVVDRTKDAPASSSVDSNPQDAEGF